MFHGKRSSPGRLSWRARHAGGLRGALPGPAPRHVREQRALHFRPAQSTDSPAGSRQPRPSTLAHCHLHSGLRAWQAARTVPDACFLSGDRAPQFPRRSAQAARSRVAEAANGFPSVFPSQLCPVNPAPKSPSRASGPAEFLTGARDPRSLVAPNSPEK